MKDWSGSLIQAERHQKKAQESLTLINAGVAGTYREALLNAAEEHLMEQMKAVVDALAWVRGLR